MTAARKRLGGCGGRRAADSAPRIPTAPEGGPGRAIAAAWAPGGERRELWLCHKIWPEIWRPQTTAPARFARRYISGSFLQFGPPVRRSKNKGTHENWSQKEGIQSTFVSPKHTCSAEVHILNARDHSHERTQLHGLLQLEPRMSRLPWRSKNKGTHENRRRRRNLLQVDLGA